MTSHLFLLSFIVIQADNSAYHKGDCTFLVPDSLYFSKPCSFRWKWPKIQDLVKVYGFSERLQPESLGLFPSKGTGRGEAYFIYDQKKSGNISFIKF